MSDQDDVRTQPQPQPQGVFPGSQQPGTFPGVTPSQPVPVAPQPVAPQPVAPQPVIAQPFAPIQAQTNEVMVHQPQQSHPAPQPNTKEEIFTLPSDYSLCNISHDATKALVASVSNHSLQMLDLSDGMRMIWETQASLDNSAYYSPVSACFSPDDTMVGVTLEHDVSCIYEAMTGKIISTLETGCRRPRPLSISKENSKILISHRKDPISWTIRNVDIWSIPDGKILASLQEHESFSSAYFFFRNESMIVGANEVSIVLWRVENGEKLQEWNGHTSEKLQECNNGDTRILSLDISSDERYLVAGSVDKTAVVWDIERGEKTITLENDCAIQFVQFSRDGGLVVTFGGASARIWNSKTGDNIGDAKLSGSFGVYSLRMNSDMTTIIFFNSGPRYRPIHSLDVTTITKAYRKPYKFSGRLIHGLTECIMDKASTSRFEFSTVDYLGFHAYHALRRNLGRKETDKVLEQTSVPANGAPFAFAAPEQLTSTPVFGAPTNSRTSEYAFDGGAPTSTPRLKIKRRLK